MKVIMMVNQRGFIAVFLQKTSVVKVIYSTISIEHQFT
jgi:hypothetical protein